MIRVLKEAFAKVQPPPEAPQEHVAPELADYLDKLNDSPADLEARADLGAGSRASDVGKVPLVDLDQEVLADIEGDARQSEASQEAPADLAVNAGGPDAGQELH